MKLLDHAQFEPAPAWIGERLARPDRAPLAPVDGFEYDGLRSIAAAYGHMGRLQREDDIPAPGNRDEHAFRFLAKMHGVGVSMERAHTLYDEYLQITGGAAPDGWPDDEKTWNKIRRIWARLAADNAPGSELMPLAVGEVFTSLAEPEPELSPVEKRWRGRTMAQLIAEPAVEFYDTMKTIPRYRNGGVAMTYGPGGHGKTNVWISRAFELWQGPEPPRMVFASGEGSQGLGARFAAQCAARDFSAVEFEGRFLATEVPIVSNLDDMRSFGEYLHDRLHPDILLIDTWSTALAGMDEDHKAAALLTSNGSVGALARALRCLIVIIHHTGKDRKSARGAVGFGWNVDMVNTIEAPSDTGYAAVQWHVERMKDGAAGHSLYYAIDYHRGVPVPMLSSKRGYELLTGTAKWEAADASSAIGGVLTRLGRPVSTLSLIMELYERGDMDPEDWQARCAALARKLDRAAREGSPALSTLYEVGEVVTWRVV